MNLRKAAGAKCVSCRDWLLSRRLLSSDKGINGVACPIARSAEDIGGRYFVDDYGLRLPYLTVLKTGLPDLVVASKHTKGPSLTNATEFDVARTVPWTTFNSDVRSHWDALKENISLRVPYPQSSMSHETLVCASEKFAEARFFSNALDPVAQTLHLTNPEISVGDFKATSEYKEPDVKDSSGTDTSGADTSGADTRGADTRGANTYGGVYEWRND